MPQTTRQRSARRPRVVGLGLCVVDHLYVVEKLDGEAERTRYTKRVVSSGGMVATAMAQAAVLGCDAHLLSVVGEDEEGRLARRSLRELGVRTRRLRSASDATGLAIVIVERGSGERRFLVADRRALERRAPPFDLSPIRRGAVLLVDGHYPGQAREAVRRAKAVGALVMGDFSAPRPEVLRLLPQVDLPVVPLEFCLAFAGDDPRDSLHRLRALGCATPMVTLGARGGLYLDGGRVRRWRARPAKVRDTTGAGDVFHGALAAGIAEGRALASSIERAATWAARCCTAYGGTGHLRAQSSR